MFNVREKIMRNEMRKLREKEDRRIWEMGAELMFKGKSIEELEKTFEEVTKTKFEATTTPEFDVKAVLTYEILRRRHTGFDKTNNEPETPVNFFIEKQREYERRMDEVLCSLSPEYRIKKERKERKKKELIEEVLKYYYPQASDNIGGEKSFVKANLQGMSDTELKEYMMNFYVCRIEEKAEEREKIIEKMNEL